MTTDSDGVCTAEGVPAGDPGHPAQRTLCEADRALVARRQRALGAPCQLSYTPPLHPVSARGAWLFGAGGERYLDASDSVPVVGHCHPRVVEAISRQTATLSASLRYIGADILDYTERLLATLPDPLDRVIYTCSGSEAVDLALRMARMATGAEGIIVTENAYHGSTAATAAISPCIGGRMPLGVHVRTVPAPDRYRFFGTDVAQAFAAEVEAAIEDLRRYGMRVAAFVADSLFDSDGIFVSPAGFLRGAMDAVHRAGGLYIADEVQCGFGRAGSHFWAFQRHGIVPDIVVMGKPMGNGYPVAGLAARSVLLEDFCEDSHYFNSMAGGPVAAAAAGAVLDVLRDENLMANAEQTGASLKAGLNMLSEEFPSFGDVRGTGLYLGVELVRDRDSREPDSALASRVVTGMRERGVLVGLTGPFQNVLKIRPPLIFSEEHVGILLTTLSQTLECESGAS
ncbi:aminotransferase class III-fold pyridoxal phosphate-dependent enzyme [Phaeovibrio sulfidiphilus]|uniref:Aminotransferase class III-fold pyridoxal phosphate-dependent enzyme n=1 Tax=Phaeovibrio sulfidiphilus TaxID=1220600 RepID=A0A8J6YKL3_9PROT|nr:aminotransferase class III-fold pyridoxal phosphate-dependent enzyme [Phaeovibrio sulfidiphilus]MBE1236133.1 aminotransferase class III-fold pyridoxal phosphate-dependent enzyme [Phaeovibrio sulfidiphilus]